MGLPTYDDVKNITLIESFKLPCKISMSRNCDLLGEIFQSLDTNLSTLNDYACNISVKIFSLMIKLLILMDMKGGNSDT